MRSLLFVVLWPLNLWADSIYHWPTHSRNEILFVRQITYRVISIWLGSSPRADSSWLHRQLVPLLFRFFRWSVRFWPGKFLVFRHTPSRVDGSTEVLFRARGETYFPRNIVIIWVGPVVLKLGARKNTQSVLFMVTIKLLNNYLNYVLHPLRKILISIDIF